MTGINSYHYMRSEWKSGEKWKSVGSGFMMIANASSVAALPDLLGEKIAQKVGGELVSGLERKGLFHMMSDRMLGDNRFGGGIFGHVGLPGSKAFKSGLTMSKRLDVSRWNMFGYHDPGERRMFRQLIIEGRTGGKFRDANITVMRMRQDVEYQSVLEKEQQGFGSGGYAKQRVVNLRRQLQLEREMAERAEEATGTEAVSKEDEESGRLAFSGQFRDDVAEKYDKMITEMQHKSAHFYIMGLAKAETLQIGWTAVVAAGQTTTQKEAEADAEAAAQVQAQAQSQVQAKAGAANALGVTTSAYAGVNTAAPTGISTVGFVGIR